MKQDIINFKDLKSQIGDLKVHYNFSIKRGEKVAIIGESGAGKSNLLNIIAGFTAIQSGELWLDGIDATNLAPQDRPVSLVFQTNNLFPHLTLYQNVALAFNRIKGLTAEQNQAIKEQLEFFKLTKYQDFSAQVLSGGQAQRTALARSLLLVRPILLLDEPFSALDYDNRVKTQDYINKIAQELDLTILLVTHHYHEVEKIVDRVIEIKDGMIIKDQLLDN